jgi:hypothetical protein
MALRNQQKEVELRSKRLIIQPHIKEKTFKGF